MGPYRVAHIASPIWRLLGARDHTETEGNYHFSTTGPRGVSSRNSRPLSSDPASGFSDPRNSGPVFDSRLILTGHGGVCNEKGGRGRGMLRKLDNGQAVPSRFQLSELGWGVGVESSEIGRGCGVILV